MSEASVSIDCKRQSGIATGLLILVGFEENDNQDDVEWLSKKIVQLRIFKDADGVMNLSVKDINGDVLVVSQFTLHAKTKKGNRPSFIMAAKPEIAVHLYNSFLKQLEFDLGKKPQTGGFGSMMDVSLINDGPVTIIIDTKNKE